MRRKVRCPVCGSTRTEPINYQGPENDRICFSCLDCKREFLVSVTDLHKEGIWI